MILTLQEVHLKVQCIELEKKINATTQYNSKPYYREDVPLNRYSSRASSNRVRKQFRDDQLCNKAQIIHMFYHSAIKFSHKRHRYRINNNNDEQSINALDLLPVVIPISLFLQSSSQFHQRHISKVFYMHLIQLILYLSYLSKDYDKNL